MVAGLGHKGTPETKTSGHCKYRPGRHDRRRGTALSLRSAMPAGVVARRTALPFADICRLQ